jgi:hypothetical protein
MSGVTLLNAVAATDQTFHREDQDGVCNCLICGGPLRFDRRTGEGATLEHNLPRNHGGGNARRNLGAAHGRCNGEERRRWDAPARRRRDIERNAEPVGRLRLERAQRWRDVAT